MQPVDGRLQHKFGHNGARILDDSYNANPESVRRAIELLSTAPGKRILVLGDLGELGAGARALHAQIGQVASAAGIDQMLTCGELSALSSQGFAGEQHHFQRQDELMEYLLQQVLKGDTVLVKGSRAARMERVVDALVTGDSPC